MNNGVKHNNIIKKLNKQVKLKLSIYLERSKKIGIIPPPINKTKKIIISLAFNFTNITPCCYVYYIKNSTYIK